MVYFMENPIKNSMDLGTPIFWKHPYNVVSVRFLFSFCPSPSPFQWAKQAKQKFSSCRTVTPISKQHLGFITVSKSSIRWNSQEMNRTSKTDKHGIPKTWRLGRVDDMFFPFPDLLLEVHPVGFWFFSLV